MSSGKKGSGGVPLPVGPITLYASYFGFALFIYLGLFAVAYSNWQVGLIAVLSMGFIVGGYYIASTSGNFRTIKNEGKKGSTILRGVAISFVGVAIGDVAVIHAYGLLGPAFGSYAGIFTQSVVPQNVFLSIGLVIALLTAISETMIFLVGFGNWFLARGGFVLGLVAVFLLTFLAHIPIDGLDLPTLTAVGLGFAIQTEGGIYGRDSAIPLIVHVLNNATALGLFALLFTLGVVR